MPMLTLMMYNVNDNDDNQGREVMIIMMNTVMMMTKMMISGRLMNHH